MKLLKLLLFLLVVIFYSCKDDTYDDKLMVGLWKQVSVTEDGIPMVLAPQQDSCKLLIDANGVYRLYHQSFISFNKGNGPTTFNGTWSMLDGTWVNFSTDKWEFIPTLSSDSDKVQLSFKPNTNTIDTATTVQKQWSLYHIQSRFTILKLTSTEMEIRLKTFVGEKKYAFLFAPNPSDFIELNPAPAGKPVYIPKLVTDQNYWTIRNEYRTQKTYIFKFKK